MRRRVVTRLPPKTTTLLRSSLKQRALAAGYKSGLEDLTAAQIAAAGLPVNYETVKVRFVQPEKARTYTPDFPLDNGIIVETKGRFETGDRQKHKWIKEQHPNLEIRFVFSRSSTRLSKKSPTTYAAWCEQHGFLYADKTIPVKWLSEPVNGVWKAAIEKAGKK